MKQDRCLHELFREQVARTPDAVALVARGERLTYAELADRAGQLAAWMRRAGVGPEKRVAVCLERSADLIAALLGTLEAGGAYVPLDPAYPEERLAYLLEDCGAEVLLTSRGLVERLPATGVRTVLLEDLTPRPPLPSHSPLPGEGAPPPNSGNLAYVLYTSGSTGLPKGVALEHRSAVAFLEWAGREFSAAELAGVLAATSISFDLSVFEIFLPLARGGTVILAENALAFATLPEAGEVTLLNTVPSLLAELLRVGSLPPSVRTVNLAGEPLRRALVDRIEAVGTVERVYNLYGPTESTTYATWTLVPQGTREEPTLGRAIAGTRVVLLDERLEPVPAGEPGEIFLGGAGLARGYLDRPALTAERFVPDPSSVEPGGRVYKTGDLGRLLPSGEVEYLGRADHQIKVQGLRIEPGEIETGLMEFGGIRESLVLQRDGRLVAYLVPEAQEIIEVTELRAFLRQRLPGPLVPAAFVVLDAFPLTPNGKIDRKALPAPEASTGGFAPPRNPLEEMLVRAWSEELGVEGVGIDDDFFALGGHSLIAFRVLSRVREAFGVELHLRVLFEAPTPAALAERVEWEVERRKEGSGASPGVETPGYDKKSCPLRDKGSYALSFAQEGIWLFDRLAPGVAAYSLPVALRCSGNLDVAGFRRAVAMLIARHEVLRTTYPVTAEVAPPSEPALLLADLSTLPVGSRETEADRLAAEEARRPFNLRAGPLFRGLLVRISGEEWLAVLNLHHIAGDGWSWQVLLDELGAPELPAPPVRYVDFAEWQRRRLDHETVVRLASWWRDTLAGAPPVLELPTDRSRPASPTFRGFRVRESLAVPALRGLAQRQGSTLFMVLLAGLQALLARITGEEDLILGTPVAGRDRAELDRVVGPFVNTLPLRGRVEGGTPFRELVAAARETALSAFAHQELPFEKLVEELRVERSRRHHPLVQVMLAFQGAALLPPTLPGVEIRFEDLPVAAVPFDLDFEVVEEGDRLSVALEAASDLFDSTTAQRLLERYLRLLAVAAEEPERPVADLSLLNGPERHQLLVEWNDTEPSAPASMTVPQLFAEQARRSPQAVALVHRDRSWTYAELQGRALRIARNLRRMGVGPETRVGLNVDRSPELIAALLGIWQAGAAYVPLDPGQPEARLAAIAEDAFAGQPHPLVVTSDLLDQLQAGWDEEPLKGAKSRSPGCEPRAMATATPDATSTSATPDATSTPDAPDAAATPDAPTLSPNPGGVADAADTRGSHPGLRDSAPFGGSSGVPAPGDLAYVLYTSGTTGRPKGVMVEHGSLAHTLNACRLAFGFTPGDRMPCLAPFSFDIFLFELLAPLLAGGTSVLVDVRPAPDVPALAAALGEMTLLHAVPAVMRQIVDEVRHRGAERSLRRVFVGGDAVPPALLTDLAAVFPDARITVLYGPTETTLVASSWALAENPPDGHVIGRPLPGVSLSLRDRDGNPVPVGTPGEIWLGGPGVARGYLGRPDLTADAFVPTPTTRFYRTGDLARQLADGTVEFLGRVDQQVKVRGVRIEPGEVEAALAAHPAVRQAVVAALPDARGERVLTAWIVGTATTPIDLTDFLRGRLPEPMIPTAWVFLPDLPLTPHGKVDRRALPAPEPHEGTQSAVARTPTEEILSGILAGLLGREAMGPHEDFFAAGGHSLLAVQAISRVRDAFGVELPVGALFEAPTPAALATRLEQAGQAATPPIEPVGRDGDLPLSFAQERLWFLDQVLPGNVYNIPLALRLQGQLDPDAWERALDGVRQRHESLRTTFHSVSGGPVQVVEPFAPQPLPWIDLSALPATRRDAEATRLAESEAARPFDLSAGPLLRASLLRLESDDHIALVVCHHIVADGWSTGVLLGEIAALYAGVPVPPLQVQSPDYAVWQRRWQDGEALAEFLAWWRHQLAGHPTLDLPFDRPRPPVPSHAGALVPVEIPDELSRSLRALARETGSTLFMVLLAGFAALLHRLTGSEDVRVGTPVAHRGRPELEGMIGFLVNTLVLRVDFTDEPSGTDLLSRLRATALGAWAHQDIPFEKLVEELRPERRLDQNPLFQVAFGLDQPTVHLPWTGEGDGRGYPLSRLGGVRWERGSGGEVSVSRVPIHSGTAKFDLYAGLEEDPTGGISGFWELPTDLFDRTTVQRFAAQWLTVLTDLVADPGRHVRALPLLSAAESHQVSQEWNDTAATYPSEATLWDLFALQAERAPDAVALAQGEAELTYGELARRARTLGAHLRVLGVAPDVPVALALPKGFGLIVSILGILEAGGAYVPLDLSHPAERLTFLLRDTGAPVLLTRGTTANHLAATGVRVVDLETWEVAPPLPGDGRVRGRGGRGVRVDHLAYILYTSGSTGTPKGVAVTHRNVARLVLGTSYARFGPDEVFLQSSPIAFDASTVEIWGPLLHGGRLVLPSLERPSLAELGREIRESGVTTLWLTAGLFHQMVEEEIDGLAGLRQLLAGGDVVSPEAVRRVLEHHPGMVVIDGYGPTEGTTFSACHRMSGPADVGGSVPIGRPIANARALVLDQDLRPAPLGVPGELYLGGDGIARGYFSRPDLTAERFVPDPFADAGRLYRTGDRVRWRTDGTLDFLGRIDLQVKVAGWRVEPGEIEALLALHPAVRQSAVLVRDEPPAGRRLVAYLVASGATPDELRAWLRTRLPEPMIPALWVFLDRLPLTPNGKVDRAALAAFEIGASNAAPEEFPRSPVAELLAGLWSNLLGVERVGLQDDFFALGGHSLLATRLIARVRQLLGVDLPLRAFFETPTLGGLAEQVQLLQSDGALPPVTSAPPAETYPASLGQRRLWFLQRLAPDGFFFNISHGLRLGGPLDVEALRLSLEAIVDRHEPLRTTFETDGGLPVQRIAPPSAFPLPLVDLSALPAGRREGSARLVALEETAQPFDLVRGPLVRAALVRLSATDHVVLLNPHHLVFDGWSMDVVFRELSALYGAFSRRLPAELPPLPVRFVDFSEWQRRVLAGPLRERQLAWWKERLDGMRPLDLPTDRPRPAVQRFRGGWRTTVLPAPLIADLERMGRRNGATPYMVLLAGFSTLLARWSGQADVPVGSPVAERSRPEVEGLVGFFVNTLALRMDLGGEPRFSEVLNRVRETALGAWAHQDLPFEVLVEELVPERDLSANPLVQVTFSLEQAPAVSLPGLDTRAFDYEADVAQFDLSLIGTRAPEGLTLSMNFRTDLFDGVTAARLLEQLEILLYGAALDPELPAWELPLWSEASWHQMTREWNDQQGAAELETTVDRVFERQAARAPQALAAASDTVRLTYGELDRETNRLAHFLLRQGVRRGSRVALAIEPSPELITAQLAVWKAGGTYIPLDPAAPAERLALVIADAGAVLVLSRERWAGPLEERLEGGVAIIRLDLDRASWEDESAAAPERRTGPDDLACIIYTSGSTGVPKGAMLVHRGLLNLVAWHRRTFSLVPEDRVAQVVNPSFDVNSWETWPPLTLGASLHALPRELVSSAGEIARWMAAREITLTFLPTPMAEEFLRREPQGLSLRALYIGGDRLRHIPPRDPGFRFVNAYGPAETSVVSTAADVPPDPAPARPPSVGRPMLNAEVHLLDPRLRAVPLGAVGEICVGSPGLAAGYTGRPDLTADRFVAHPFSTVPGARLYRTGDLGRYRADGTLDFVGRADFQVKIRGVRIELGEVETQLGRHPDLRAAVAAARDDSAAGRRLVAWVVPRPGASPTAGELRDFLRARLPEVMVPTAWVVLDALPMTPRGKVDRRALPAPPAAVTSREAPEGQAERTVARLWSEILGVGAVGRDDNFFDLGGHSLALAAVHERLQTELGIRLPLVALFESTTVRSLASRLALPAEVEEAPDVRGRAERQRGAAAWKERTRQARGLARVATEDE
jgi:amino acid adenylation domain-containing protein